MSERTLRDLAAPPPVRLNDIRDLTERLLALLRFQKDGRVHPYTCRNCERREPLAVALDPGGESGARLLLVCTSCRYFQAAGGLWGLPEVKDG